MGYTFKTPVINLSNIVLKTINECDIKEITLHAYQSIPDGWTIIKDNFFDIDEKALSVVYLGECKSDSHMFAVYLIEEINKGQTIYICRGKFN